MQVNGWSEAAPSQATELGLEGFKHHNTAPLS